MEITGRIIEILPVQSGSSQKGEWKKQLFILETSDQFPKKLCIEAWNDKINLNFDTSKTVKVYFDVESREFNGKWYTNIRAWKMEVLGDVAASGPVNQADSNFIEPSTPANDLDGDLPF